MSPIATAWVLCESEVPTIVPVEVLSNVCANEGAAIRAAQRAHGKQEDIWNEIFLNR